MNKIYQEIEILTITFKSDHIIEDCLSNIDENFKVVVVENSDNKNFKNKIEKRKNTKCILTSSNLGFGAAFNIGAKKIKSTPISPFRLCNEAECKVSLKELALSSAKEYLKFEERSMSAKYSILACRLYLRLSFDLSSTMAIAALNFFDLTCCLSAAIAPIPASVYSFKTV